MARPKHSDTVSGAILYARVSSAGQAAEGASLEAQEQACRRLAELKGWPVLGSYSDAGISGRKDEARRPGLASVIAASQSHPGAVVVVYSLSRLSRSQRGTWRLLDDRGEYRLRVSSVTEPWDMSTAMGRAMLGVLAVWNQLEADLAGERTKAALAYVRSQGVRLGRPPETELSEAKRDLIRRVQSLQADLRLPLRSLAAELEKRGIQSVNGAKWHPRTLRKALAVQLEGA